MIRCLEFGGYDVLEESASEVLREFPDMSEDERQREIFRIQFQREADWEGEKVFLDRSIIDVLIYTKYLTGRIPEGMESKRSMLERYDGVFVLERLPFKRNDVRIESGEREVGIIHRLIIEGYRECGYAPIEVPVMSVEKRAEFILRAVE